MDQITARKIATRRDLHLRPGFTPLNATMYKSSEFTGMKAQGGGIYSVTTKSRSQLANLQIATKNRLGSANITSSRFAPARANSFNKTSHLFMQENQMDSPIKKQNSDAYVSPLRQPIKGTSSFS